MKPLLRLLFFIVLFKLVSVQEANAQKFTCGAPPIEKINFSKVRPLAVPGPAIVPNYCLNRTITISAFIVLDTAGKANVTESDINAAISGLNVYWSNICLSFKICKFTYIKDYTYNTWSLDENHAEGVKVYHDDPHVINMYFADTVKGANKKLVGGYADTLQPVVIMKTSVVNMKNCIAHELGHFFGLAHTFGNTNISNELVDGSNSATAADGFKDTEADPDDTGSCDANCNYTGTKKKDANGDYYLPPIGNVMSYFQGCECGFTNEQLNYMAEFSKTAGMKDLW